MAAPLVKVKNNPGIYRRGSRYVYTYRVDGRQRWGSCRTLDEARRAKRQHMTAADAGEIAGDPNITLRAYIVGDPDGDEDGWIDTYRGNGKRGIREETRAEYRALLEKYALEFFSRRTKLAEITPARIDKFIGWLVKQPNGRGGTLSDKSVRNALGPLMACLAHAKRTGLIHSNPAVGAALPHRPQIEEDDEKPRPFPRRDNNGQTIETMELVVSFVHPDHRLMFELLAATGMRRSELLALAVRHVDLNDIRPYVKLRQRTRWQKGKGQVIGPMKSQHARRELPIPQPLASELRDSVEARGPDDLVFESPLGGPYDPAHLYHRVLAPACAEAGVEWAGFHTFRHTVASRMFAAGRNTVQVQKWLGHHSAAFTLNTYVHLLNDEDLGGPMVPLPAKGANKVQTRPTPLHATREERQAPEMGG